MGIEGMIGTNQDEIGNETGMTKPREWSNSAEWCRQDCLSLARQGRAILWDVLDAVSDPVVLRKIAKAIEAYREIESKLLEVKGGKNDPA